MMGEARGRIREGREGKDWEGEGRTWERAEAGVTWESHWERVGDPEAKSVNICENTIKAVILRHKTEIVFNTTSVNILN